MSQTTPTSDITPEPELPAASIEEPESLRQPLWHVIVLCLLTCNAYGVYWCYKTWRDLASWAAKPQPEDAAIIQFKDISPLLRTIGLAVIILDIYLLITLIKGIAEIYPRKESYVGRHPLISTGLVVGSCIGVLSLYLLPKAYFLLSFLAGVPLAVAQSWLNQYWLAEEPSGLVVRHAFTLKEMGAIILGSVWLGLIVAGFFILPG